MISSNAEISVNGETLKVPSTSINGRMVVVTGKNIRVAGVKDEEFFEGEAVDNADVFVEKLRGGELKVDIFNYSRKFPDAKPNYAHLMEWDNSAVIPIKSYADWWEKLPQESRRNVRKAAKVGVAVRQAEFNDEFVRGISSIYNETPVRQGRPFWHYGKDFETVKKENATYLERSELIGAYLNGELIGFLKMVYVERTANIMQILTKNQHYDKRPANALIAKAVEICEKKGMSSLVYCKYIYGKNDQNPLTEFKRRNGFEQVLYPRYFVPLTMKGRLVLSLRLHHGLSGVIPKRLWLFLVGLRARFFELVRRRKDPPAVGCALPENCKEQSSL